MDTAHLSNHLSAQWRDSITPALIDYIAIPNKSPLFDPDWARHGHMMRAVKLAETWVKSQPITGMSLRVVELEGRTPILLIEIAGQAPGTVLLYGHLDKQPEMTGWHQGLGPWRPVIKDDKLYGRGGADDGYAVFAAIAAIHAVQTQGISHARCVVLIECCEESGSFDLPFYIEHLHATLGTPDLVVCLDSGCGNYDQLWLTTSLRGLVNGDLAIEVLTEGVHSGDASGVVPSSFRIARALLSRFEDEVTGVIRDAVFQAEIPVTRHAEAHAAAAILGAQVHARFPFAAGTQAVGIDPTELILNRTWRPALSVTGAAGLPALEHAGNVLRPRTTLRLSLRLPPTTDAEAAGAHLKNLLECDPLHGARVDFHAEQATCGWHAPLLAPWLEAAVQKASLNSYGLPAMAMGEGGSIPFMHMLGERFPQAQFLITGVLGPHSNAHGPNEFLHLGYAEKLTACVAHVLAAHGARVS